MALEDQALLGGRGDGSSGADEVNHPSVLPPGMMRAEDYTRLLPQINEYMAQNALGPAARAEVGLPESGQILNQPLWTDAQNQRPPDPQASTGNQLLSYVGNTFGGSEAPSPQTSQLYPLPGGAVEAMMGHPLPVDPRRVVFNGQEAGFSLDKAGGPDLFGGKLPNNAPLSQIPRELQPLLAQALVKFYKDADYAGGAAHGQMSAPWTRFYAPPAPALDTTQGSTWPGITKLDPWGRSLGEYANLYS